MQECWFEAAGDWNANRLGPALIIRSGILESTAKILCTTSKKSCFISSIACDSGMTSFSGLPKSLFKPRRAPGPTDAWAAVLRRRQQSWPTHAGQSAQLPHGHHEFRSVAIIKTFVCMRSCETSSNYLAQITAGCGGNRPDNELRRVTHMYYKGVLSVVRPEAPPLS